MDTSVTEQRATANERGAADYVEFTAQEFQEFLATGDIKAEHQVRYTQGERTLENGRCTLNAWLCHWSTRPPPPAIKATHCVERVPSSFVQPTNDVKRVAKCSTPDT